MVINGGLSVDDRGILTFVNEFDFKDIKRFYTVRNHAKGLIRAWHGHKKEGKYVFVVKGTILLAIVSMKKKPTGERHVLSESIPRVLYIEPGNYHGFRTLTDDTQVMFFSTATLEESQKDDLREPASKWNLLQVVER